MANEDYVRLLKQGSEVWNKWREEGHVLEEHPDLREADLSQTNLRGANLSGADLSFANLGGAYLFEANLSGADLSYAKLYGAKLHWANLSGAVLSVAKLQQADLHGANLRKARLRGARLHNADLNGANLRRADLSKAFLIGTKLRGANLTEVNVTGVRWNASKMRRRYGGIRGIESCYGNALFKRAAADQDFLDTLEDSWKPTWRRHLFQVWGWIDYGRSLGIVVKLGVAVTVFFATVYEAWPNLLHSKNSLTRAWFSPYYYSIVTFTTLGFGDISPANSLGEILAALEVVAGYVNLGLLLAVLADKVTRRS